ncbi:hypothetical protein JYT51_01950, partial [Candidatus Amoebophilus asiaticus]|nr:hypothetical protein [Candidatus Amoebophilus asiaticus]
FFYFGAIKRRVMGALKKEVQYKIANKVYLGFSLVHFFLVLVVFTAGYALASGQFLQAEINQNGHLPYVALFLIIPTLFLIGKLTSKISVRLRAHRLSFTNSYFLLPVKWYSFNLSDYRSFSISDLKNPEAHVNFGKMPKVSMKVFLSAEKKP